MNIKLTGFGDETVNGVYTLAGERYGEPYYRKDDNTFIIYYDENGPYSFQASYYIVKRFQIAGSVPLEKPLYRLPGNDILNGEWISLLSQGARNETTGDVENAETSSSSSESSESSDSSSEGFSESSSSSSSEGISSSSSSSSSESAVLWTPSEIPTAAWFDANDATTVYVDGGSIMHWDDKSGNSKHMTQASAAEQPTYIVSDPMANNMGSLYLGSFKGMDGTGTLSAKRIYLVSYFGDGTTTPFNAISGTSLAYPIDGLLAMRGGGTVSVWNDEGVGQFTRLGGTIWKNGDDTVDQNQALPMPLTIWEFNSVDLKSGNFELGRSPLYSWDGGICELIYTDGTESIATRQKVEGYLAWKWGLEGNLPVSHPYKSAPPLV